MERKTPAAVGRTDDHKPISAKALAEEFDAGYGLPIGKGGPKF